MEWGVEWGGVGCVWMVLFGWMCLDGFVQRCWQRVATVTVIFLVRDRCTTQLGYKQLQNVINCKLPPSPFVYNSTKGHKNKGTKKRKYLATKKHVYKKTKVPAYKNTLAHKNMYTKKHVFLFLCLSVSLFFCFFVSLYFNRYKPIHIFNRLYTIHPKTVRHRNTFSLSFRTFRRFSNFFLCIFQLILYHFQLLASFCVKKFGVYRVWRFA